MKLAELQERFWRLITAPEPVSVVLPAMAADDPEMVPLRGWIAAESESAATERLDIYANMYFFRLLDVLRGDYPNLVKLVGDEAFHDLVTGFLLAHPSDNPSLRWIGRRLPDFLASHSLAARFPAAAALARLEWVRGEVFDVEDSPIATVADLAAVSPEAWSAMRLGVQPAVRIIDLDFAVLPLWLALERGEAERPEAPPGAALALVWRRGFRVYHRRVDAAEAACLRAAIAGAVFASLCETLWEFAGEETAKRAVGYLRSWLDEGLVASVISQA